MSWMGFYITAMQALWTISMCGPRDMGPNSSLSILTNLFTTVWSNVYQLTLDVAFNRIKLIQMKNLVEVQVSFAKDPTDQNRIKFTSHL